MISARSYCHSHETGQKVPLSSQPFLPFSKRQCFCGESGQTNVAASHYFAQLLRFLTCSGTNGIPGASPLDIHPSDQRSKYLLSNDLSESLDVGMFFRHDPHIPSQRAGRYRDNKPSRSRACWIFFYKMPHFIKLHDDRTSRLGFVVRLLGKLTNPFQNRRGGHAKKLGDCIE